MNYFKVFQDFSRYIPISEKEYEKALYAFITGKPAVFEMGATSRIESIVPDLNRMRGWNSDYKPNQDDNNELEAARNGVRPFMAKVRDRVEYLIANKQEHLIGKNVEIPELDQPKNKELTAGTEALANKMKV